ncbi:MAG: hypothetical protein Kow00124_20190 [Anaerolineae bacterium]
MAEAGINTLIAAPERARPAARWKIAAQAIGLLAAFMVLFSVIQLGTPALVGNDGYYHVKMGQLMRMEGLTPAFRWLPLSILNEADYYDHHFLYHVYLALFIPGNPAAASPADLTLAGKAASVVMPSLAFLAIWWLLRGQGVRHAWLWALGLFAVSSAFLYRMSMPRAQSASLLVLALAMHWMLKRRWLPLIGLGFVYVWLYNAFPLLLAAAGAYTLAVLLSERRLIWQPLAAAAAGVVLGLVINPYFPQNVSFIASHILPKLLATTAERVGREWYPYETWTLVENSGVALGLFVLGAFGLGWRGQRMDRHTLFAFGMAVLFGVMVLRSRRFVEYFPAFALIFAAFSLTPLLDDLEKRVTARVTGRWSQAIVPAGLAAVIALPLALGVIGARDDVGDSKRADLYAAAAGWLADHAQPGALVFQTDWDDFPRLFFYNTASVYTIGLDVTYMSLYDADLFDEWVDISRGRVEEPGAVIADRFGADYVFSDLDHGAFLEQAARDPLLREVYRDGDAVIFEVLEAGD